MDIIEQAEEILVEQQKQNIVNELIDTYEALLDYTWKLVLEQRKVINGIGDMQKVEELYEGMDDADKLADMIDKARAFLKEN